jgi:hypothetical protein
MHHLFCIGQNFPLLYFYIVIRYVNQTKHWVITPIVHDLGKFNTIQHGIDTGTNRPVKQRIRRTPLGFAGEEEAQLKKSHFLGFNFSPYSLNLTNTALRLAKCPSKSFPRT